MQPSTKPTWALSQLERLNNPGECPAFALEMALQALLAIETSELLANNDHQLLLIAALRAHASAIEHLGNKIGDNSINLGMGAVYSVLEALRTGLTGTDLMKDARARVKILIHHCRIAQHEADIENRRLARQRADVKSLITQNDVEDIFS